MRLDKFLHTQGFGTRSELHTAIRRGQASVDGVVVYDPGMAVDPKNVISFQGKTIDTRLIRHVMLHKPAGLLTAARDKKQSTVMDLLPKNFATLGCMPVGRLDKDTTGLLLFTTDGEMNHRLLAPGRHVDKTYIATVLGTMNESAKEQFAAGMDLGDFVTRPAALEILETNGETSVCRITVHEGQYHQVKRMCDHVGCPVTALHRESFGPLVLGDLPVGEWRDLTPEEVTALYQAAEMDMA